MLLSFLDYIKSHQDAESFYDLHMVAIEDDAVQHCHYSMLTTFNNVSTPVMEHFVGIIYFGPKLSATAKLIVGDLKDFSSR